MKKLQYILLLTTLVAIVALGCNNSKEKIPGEQSSGAIVYQCPMDCENGKTYDKPGKCPVCEMDLEKK